jgi:membrane-bound serine protease (ClpP class)
MYSPLAGGVALGLYLVLGPFAAWFGFKWWLNSPIARHFVLSSEVDRLQRNVGPDAPPEPREDPNAELRALIGVEGEAVTPLRPVGTVLIHEERIEALAESGSIPAGARIVVVDVYDNQIKVREQR